MPQIGPGKGDGFDGHEDFGRERVTGDARDRHKFRTPTLRNVALTAPWGHAGAYDTRSTPLGARLHAVFSSDIGHWDVPDMAGVLPEAYELLERGLLTEADFRAFVFESPLALWQHGNPDFFAGTSIESEAGGERP